MSTTLAYLALLLPFAAVAWIVWSYRRKAGEKEARSRERAVALLGVPGATAGSKPAAVPERPAPPVGAVPAVPVPAAPVPDLRERFLSQQETLVYYLLKTALAGYEVFPHVCLAAVIADAPAESGADSLRSARHDLDFVVCDKGLRVLAVVRLEKGNPVAAAPWADRRIAVAGIRVVRFDTAALPRRDQVRALVLGIAS